ncbi:MAG: cytochrome P460 family protein [Flavobacteriales bacterium]|nr:cytochrome P460 family protein [Flavobacteriales bacterium]MCB9166417.1 cytochrome P460 family protein [Flavobacteriales bacterium]
MAPIRAFVPPLVLACLITACKHGPDGAPIDDALYRMALDQEGHVWYGFSDALLPKSAGSGHGEPLLRTRYNDVAATLLDSMGKVLPDTVFPVGALVVKELWENDGTIGTYAVLFKKPSEPAADADGWVWGYFTGDGEVRVTALDQGAACRTCHGQPGHIDRTLMNIYFP